MQMTFTHPDNAPEGHKWQTRGGRAVRIICTDAKGEDGSIVALVQWDDGEAVIVCHESGQYFRDDKDHYCDIIDAPKPKRVIEGWLNLYRGYDVEFGGVHPTKKDADDEAMSHRIACIHIRAEEGEGLR
jgi:hypothetical protein